MDLLQILQPVIVMFKTPRVKINIDHWSNPDKMDIFINIEHRYNEFWTNNAQVSTKNVCF